MKDDELQSVNAIKSAMLADFTDWDGIAESIQVQSWKDNKRSNSYFFKFQEIMDVNFKLDELKILIDVKLNLMGEIGLQKALFMKKSKNIIQYGNVIMNMMGKLKNLNLKSILHVTK